MVECLWWLNWIVLKSLRFWIGVSLKHWFIDWTSTWPETTATHFMGICFYCHITGHIRCTWMQRGCSSRKSSDCQIKSPPEKMYWANFAYKPLELIQRVYDFLVQEFAIPVEHIQNHRFYV